MLPFQRRQWQPTPVLLPGKSHGCRSLVGYSPWDCKQSDMTEQLLSSLDTITINKRKKKKKVLGRPPSTGYCKSSTVKHNQVFQRIRFVYLPSHWRGVSRLPSHVEAKEVLPENKLRKTPSLCTSLVCYTSEDPKKGAGTLGRRPPYFATIAQVTPPLSPGLEASRD